ncbi:MAG: hypothetical protein ABJQ34_19095 [Paracoccaceae bacterium]
MFVATRLRDAPIVLPKSDVRMGNSINGPSLIKVPSWVNEPKGRYYLYYAEHKGRFIGLAYADDLCGPWQIHSPGVLDLSQSLFLSEVPPVPPEDLRPDWAEAQGGDYLYPHIASPDVHVDHELKQIRMYFHGLLPRGDQQTRLATSSDGLAFNVEEPLLGPAYFRVFEHETNCYAISWGGKIFRASSPRGPFEAGQALVPKDALSDSNESVRHVGVQISDKILWLFFSCIGAKPESIHVAEIPLSGDWKTWQPSRITKLLVPELDWEGAGQPETTSIMGPPKGFSAALLDPFVFQDGYDTYMLYVGGGEFGGIGICALHPLSSFANDTAFQSNIYLKTSPAQMDAFGV